MVISIQICHVQFETVILYLSKLETLHYILHRYRKFGQKNRRQRKLFHIYDLHLCRPRGTKPTNLAWFFCRAKGSFLTPERAGKLLTTVTQGRKQWHRVFWGWMSFEKLEENSPGSFSHESCQGFQDTSRSPSHYKIGDICISLTQNFRTTG